MIVWVFQFLIFVYSVVLHEIAHGWVADKLGDPTARLAKRLTLNPMSHIDPIMTIALPLVLSLLGMPVFGAAKAVPVDPFNFRDGRKDMAIVALCGPLTNIAIAIFFALIFRMAAVFILNETILDFLQSVSVGAIRLNLFLAFFNLFPLPPLDGYRVVGGIIPKEFAHFWASLERFGFMLVFAFLFLFQGVFFSFVNPLVTLFFKILVG